MTRYSVAERIATIVAAARRGHLSGKFGHAVDISADTAWEWRVWVEKTESDAHGCMVLVRRRGDLWHVSSKGIVGAETNLEDAARFALENSEGVNVTRNYPIETKG